MLNRWRALKPLLRRQRHLFVGFRCLAGPRRLRRDRILCKRQFVIRMKPVAGGIHNRRGDKNHQVLFDRYLHLALKETADNRQITHHRHLVLLGLGRGRNQPAQNDRLAIPNIHRGEDLSNIEARVR